MKRIFLLMAVLLVWHGAVMAAELKVMVPVDEFKKMQARLDELEKENSQLKLRDATPANRELENRLQTMENENGRLQQDLVVLKSQSSGAASADELKSRLEAMERENRQLKEAKQSGVVAAGSGGIDVSMQTRLEAAENENNRLKQDVKMLKAGVLAETYAASKISAREQYFHDRRKNVSHIYKF